MKLGLYTAEARCCIDLAEDIARNKRCYEVDTCFLLFACGQKSSEVRAWLKDHGIVAHKLSRRLPGSNSSEPPQFSNELLDVLELAEVLAGSEAVTPLHMLAAIIASDPPSRACDLLWRRGLRTPRPRLVEDLRRLLPSLP